MKINTLFESRLDFHNTILVPQYSSLSSRSDVNLYSHKLELKIPIISAAMDTVTEKKMQIAMSKAGGLGIHHRYTDTENLKEAVVYGPIAISPSMGISFIKSLMEIAKPNYPTFVIDVAHGDSAKALELAAMCVGLGANVWSGNIVTASAARRYLDIGVNTLKVGVANGSVCTTSEMAGVGKPQLSAIMDIRMISTSTTIISDGGVKCAGDIVKALAVGADAIITGRLFTACEEAPKISTDNAEYKTYRGMASQSALIDAGKEVNVEGVEERVHHHNKPVSEIISEICAGIKAGMAYCGAKNVIELREKAELFLVES